jgi:CPA2 family monovalent cation:H+ antiporter-2
MPHETALIAIISVGLGLAFVFGFLAARLRLPPLVGYLVAGVLVGPFTPGFVAEAGLARQLAEIGVILLMFGVGIHFSLRDLMAVRRIVVPGAVVQIAVAASAGALLSRVGWGWSWGAAGVFGLALSVASTVVVLRTLEERGMLDSADGRVAVGWLIVQDLAMVLAVVLLPALAGGATLPPGQSLAGAVAVTLLKVTLFIALMLFVGARAIPWLLARVARTGSRELFTLSVLAVALGIAVGAASLFGVSFALGAFFAGVVISESDLSHQAAADALPLQDAFAVLFFVSVGMLVNPAIIVQRPLALLATLLVIIVANALPSLVVSLALGAPVRTALTLAAGLAQIGEFSFILAGIGLMLGVLPVEGHALILTAALLSIVINPLLFRGVAPLELWLQHRPRLLAALERAPSALSLPPKHVESGLRDHAVIVGYGRVGGTIGRAFERAGVPFIVIEANRAWAEELRDRGIAVLFGDAARGGILEHAHVDRARLLVIATPGAYRTREILRLARKLNPRIDTVVRTHSAAEQHYLESRGVGMAVMGEHELALGMARYALLDWEPDPQRAELVVEAVRDRTRGETSEEG